MDVFTQTALARAGFDAAATIAARAEGVEHEAARKVAADPGPIAIEDRLALAYGSPVPKAMIDFFVHWRLPPHPRWDQYQQRQTAREIARMAEMAAAAARGHLKEAAERLARLEARLAEIEAQHSSICTQLQTDPPAMADPLEVGQQSAIKAGCERLLPVLRREIETARPEPERALREGQNWDILYTLGEVIAGFMRASDGLARDLGFSEAWEVCPDVTRRQRAEKRREEAAAKREEVERRSLESARLHAEREAAVAEREAREATVDALDFVELASYLFFEGQELTLDELKARAAEWDHRQLGMLKEAVRLWPETLDPDLSMAVSREISDWLDRRRISPIYAPSTEEDLINRAAKRLARIIHHYGRDYAA